MTPGAERVDAVVVGAGVIGLACARALAERGVETLILERHAGFGHETSSRNSEVIHGGLYYPTDSLKARFCVEGKEALYRYCEARGIPHRRCGKLIVATAAAHESKLAELCAQGRRNGVSDLILMRGEDARTLEPELAATAALLSPSTGIIDSHALMMSLLGDAERHGALLVTRSEFQRAQTISRGFVLEVTGDHEPYALEAGILVNAAGLAAPALAARIAGLSPSYVPGARYAKGNYFSLATRAPFSRLIYPVPEPGGLGVHLTLDLAGQARFGPDVEWVETLDYDVDPRRADSFYAKIREYWPRLPDHALQPAYSGIRPKLAAPHENADFLIQGAETHGVTGLVNLFGIESPGLTSCLPIATHVCRLLGLA